MHLEDNPVDIIGDPVPLFKETYALYYETKSLIKSRFDNRENFINLPQEEKYPTSDLLTNDFVKQQMSDLIYQRLYSLLRDELTTDEDEGNGYNHDVEDDEYNPNELVFMLSRQGTLCTGIEQTGDNTFQVEDMFKIQTPFAYHLLKEVEECYVKIEYDDTGGFNTECWLITEWKDSPPPEDSELVKRLFKTNMNRAQREATAIFSEGMESVLVATGERAVTTCNYPDRYTDMKRFPVDSFEWSSGDGEDIDEDDELEMDFLYNTNLTTEEELEDQLDPITAGGFNRKEEKLFGQFLGYPEYALNHYNKLMAEEVPPAYSMSINFYYDLLDDAVHPDEISLMEYVSYVSPLIDPHFSETKTDAEEKREVIQHFIEEYGLSSEPSVIDYVSGDELSVTFEEFWRIIENDPEFEV